MIKSTLKVVGAVALGVVGTLAFQNKDQVVEVVTGFFNKSAEEAAQAAIE